MVERDTNRRIRIDLTPEQKEQVRKATGMELASVELEPETLEERIAPVVRKLDE